MRHSFFIVLLAFTVSVVAQIPVGYWRTHFSYTNTTKVLDTPDAVYGISTKDMENGINHDPPYQKAYFTANNAALFVYNKEDESTEILTKIQGLSESLCSQIAYSDQYKTLVLAYDNNNIDLMVDRQVFNIPELKLKMMSVSKRINSITFYDYVTYLATDFGFVSINLLKREFVDTFIFSEGGKCFQIQHFNGYLFAFFEKGVWRCPIQKNVMDKNNWEKIITPSVFVKSIALEDKLIVLSQSGQTYRYKMESNSWVLVNSDTHTMMEQTPHGFVISNGYSLSMYDQNVNQLFYSNFPFRIRDLSSVKHGYLWAAAGERGLENYQIVENNRLELFRSHVVPVGPIRNESFSMRSSGNKILVTAGGAFYNVQDIPGAFYVFENENWWSADFSKVSSTLDLTGKTKKNLVEVIEDPKCKNRFFASSWEDGLYEFIGDSCVNLHTRYNTNEVLEELYVGGYLANRYRLGGLCADRFGNIWMGSSLADRTLFKVYRQDNGLFDQTVSKVRAGYMKDFHRTNSGNIWGVVVRDAGTSIRGVLVFNAGSSIDDKSDDSYYRMTQFVDQDNQLIAAEDFYALVVDRTNVVWVGHRNGLLTITNGDTSVKSVLSGAAHYRVNRPKVPRNDGTNYADYLMEGQSVQAIAVDGANRKWIGTENNGIYVVSENGTEVLANYNRTNSPLLSNSVKSIAIQPSSGEVFIGTDSGICSFRAEATDPEGDFSQVNVFPNPVRPDYIGLITINGLMEGSFVRITDMNGHSVNEGKSLGGQYIWNGLNYNKQKVASGVYLVFAASNNGKQGVVAKIMIIK